MEWYGGHVGVYSWPTTRLQMECLLLSVPPPPFLPPPHCLLYLSWVDTWLWCVVPTGGINQAGGGRERGGARQLTGEEVTEQKLGGGGLGS